MAINAKPFFIKVITPLHAGSGSDLGVVDLPIQREVHTAFPKIEGSSLKGAIRSDFTDKMKRESNKGTEEDKQAEAEQKAEAIFGTGDKAGDLGFSDARILFFPVKSVKGVFAYVTCPMVLKRFNDDMRLVHKAGDGTDTKLDDKNSFEIPKVDIDDDCVVLVGNKNTIDGKNVVILEEYSFTIQETKSAESIEIPKLVGVDEKRIVIISDDNFKHFVQNSTEVITRIRIGKNRVVDKENGALFTEEYLPAETIMYASAIGETEKFTNDTPTTLQIGGNSTLGKGIVELTIGVKEEGGK